MNVGLTTGFMHKDVNPLSEEAINVCREISLGAIEINCVGGLTRSGVPVSRITRQELDGFGHISLHAPCSKIIYRDDQATRDILAGIQLVCERLPISLVVFHVDNVSSWNPFINLPFNWAIENMDRRKQFGQNHRDLAPIFDRFDCGFVLDLNHCYTVDPTMKLAEQLIINFQDKIREIHLSGYIDYHEPLFETNQLAILRAIPDKNIPIILEALCKSAADARKEFEYVVKFLSN